MSNVTELHPTPREGEPSFLMCDCEPGGVPFVVCATVEDTPAILSLVCPECEQAVPVTNGYVGWEGE